MIKYMEPTDKDAFLDFPKKERADYLPSDYVECPVCMGHGGWNLSINSYPLHSHADTSENRHLYSHFRTNCNQCNGWGQLDKKNTVCIHTLVHDSNVGNCLNRYKCCKCDHTEVWDSSD